VTAWARRFTGEQARTLSVMQAMTHAVKAEFRYQARHEEGTQTAAETIARGPGTCRDFVVLMMEALRSFGVATRQRRGARLALGNHALSRLGFADRRAWDDIAERFGLANALEVGIASRAAASSGDG